MILFVVVALIAFTARLAAAEPNPDEVLDEEGALTSAADAASFDPGWSDVGAAEEREAAHHDRPTRNGRIDLTITWRRTVRVASSDDALHGIASALDPVTTARGVLWVLLSWSR